MRYSMTGLSTIFDYISFTKFLIVIVALGGILLAKLLTKKENRARMPGTLDVVRRYKWMFILFLVIYFEKNWVDRLNHPIRYYLGLDFTDLIHSLEGDFIYYFQSTFESKYLTNFFAPFYIVSYIFVNYFSVIYFGFQTHTRLTAKMAINYMVIYIISIPFYLFTPVDVTSNVIKNVNPILYEYSPVFHEFFNKVDPLDNCFPSLHIAIPFSLFLLMWHHRKRNNDHRFDRYLYIVIAINLLYVFAILYLGVHWLIDIIGGVLVGWLGWIMVETLTPKYLYMTRRADQAIRYQLKSITYIVDTPGKFREYVRARSERMKKQSIRPFSGSGIEKRSYQRILAALIDIVIVLIPGLLLFREFQFSLVKFDDFWFFTLLVYFLYFVSLEYFFQTTVGKRIFSLRIVSIGDTNWAVASKTGSELEAFSPIGFKEVFKRNAYKLFYPLVLIDYAVSYLHRVQLHFSRKRKERGSKENNISSP